MNGIDKILERIEADSRAEIESIEADARARCEAIRADGDRRAQEQYAGLITAGAKRAEERISRLKSVAELEARKQVLATKQEMVSLAFDRAVDMIADLDDQRYIALLASLAVRASSDGTEKLIFSAADRARVGKAVCQKANAELEARGTAGRLTLSEETRDIRAGLVISAGDIEVNCTAESLVSGLRGELASKVASVLFD